MSTKEGIMNSSWEDEKVGNVRDLSGRTLGSCPRGRGEGFPDREHRMYKGKENIVMPFRGPVWCRDKCVQLWECFNIRFVWKQRFFCFWCVFHALCLLLLKHVIHIHGFVLMISSAWNTSSASFGAESFPPSWQNYYILIAFCYCYAISRWLVIYDNFLLAGLWAVYMYTVLTLYIIFFIILIVCTLPGKECMLKNQNEYRNDH